MTNVTSIDERARKYAQLRRAWHHHKETQTDESWALVMSAMRLLQSVLTPKQRSDMWREKRKAEEAEDTDSLYWDLVELDRVWKRKYSATPRAKANRQRLDQKRAADPKRQEQVRVIQARYRAKKKALLLATREAQNV